LYAQADLLICGGGLVKYECGYCAIPTVTLSRTPEQEEDSLRLVRKDLTFNLGRIDADVADRVADGLASFLKTESPRRQRAASRRLFREDSVDDLARGILS
jgi:UDP:flavonoid glycosyltransferase YjiC (YdhE family)